MQLVHILSLSSLLFVRRFSPVNCEIVEFETFVPPSGPWGRQPILLEDSGYTNLLVAIHRDVKESSSVIDGIKEIFTLTSQMLQDATDQALYFREISILVPDNWNDSSDYARSRPNETFHTARVIIRNETSRGSPPSYPFVRQLGGSDSEGEYMYLPSGLLTNMNGPLKNETAEKILNLWGCLRWGLEEAHIQRSQQLWTINKTPWEQCMENSVDFKLSRDAQGKNHTGVIPVFRLLRHRDILSVVILDARKNMEENNKFERMKKEFKNYVWNLFPAYSRMGVVVVSNESHKLLPVSKLWESPGFRNETIIQELPQRTNGNSSLGEGFRLAKTMLSDARRDISGSFILVMSDGTDNVAPNVNDVIQEVSSDGVVIASLPFSPNISENIVLNNTVNQNFTIKKTNQLHRLEDEDRYVRIFQSNEETFLPNQSKQFLLSMDRDTRMDSIIVRVRSNVSMGWEFMDILSYSENGSYPSEGYPSCHTDDHEMVDVVIFENAVQLLEIQSNIPQTVSFEVFSRISSFDNEVDEAIRIRPFSKSKEVKFSLNGTPLYASVTKNENPVISVSNVTAKITSPDGMTSELQLMDDGFGADQKFQDGVYSSYFNAFTTEGEYTVALQIFSGQGSCILRISPEELINTLPLLSSNEDCSTNNGTFQGFPLPISFTVTAIPPNTITDLTADIDESKRIVRLSWTAAGEDLTIGRASYYEIRFGQEPFDIGKNFDNATSISECEGEPENSTQSFPSKVSFCGDFSQVKGKLFRIAIRAVDSHGNRGNVSDGILVAFPVEGTTTTEPTIRPTKAMVVSLIEKFTDTLQTKPFIATSILGIVVILAVIIGLKKYLKKKKKGRETVVFTPRPRRNRVTPTPSPCLSRSSCNVSVIVLEDI